jgi:predicted nuclease of restriction endonuclease-like (RecB) superfamily
LGQSKRPEEREFYLRLAIRERWGKRELERQLRAAAFERAVLSPAKVSPVVAQVHPLIAEYQTQLPDKKLLQAKLHEFYALTASESVGQEV